MAGRPKKASGGFGHRFQSEVMEAVWDASPARVRFVRS